MNTEWPPVTDLVPHTGVARLLTQIVASGPHVIEAVGAIQAQHPLVSKGLAPTLLAIELGAQAAAAMEALGRRGSSGHATSQTGTLVRVRDASFHSDLLPVDTPIQVFAELVGSAPPLAMYRIVATLNGKTVVEAVINTHAGSIGGRD